MVISGDGPRVVAALWIMTAIVFFWVVLRNYTRGILLRSFGIDDHVFNVAFVLLMGYATFLTISTHYGFNRDLQDIPKDGTRARAVFYQSIGQTFLLIDMALAKWSLGLFLLRLVYKTWHKVALWTMMLLLMGTSISVVFAFWFRCTPATFGFDQKILGGYCSINILPVSYLFTGLCVLADFFFAFFPWLFIWKLNLKPREKALILSSLSLGIIAGVCGIKRTLVIYTLNSPNYSKDTVPLMIWAGVEIAVTMICIGIAVCLPLYKRIYSKFYNLRSDNEVSVDRPKAPELGLIGLNSIQWPTPPPSIYAGLSGTTLPARWPSSQSGAVKTKKKHRYRRHRSNFASRCLETAPPNAGVWGLRGFDQPFTTSLTTSIVGGRGAIDESEDILISSLRGAVVREGVITDEEALTGVVVTKEFEVRELPRS